MVFWLAALARILSLVIWARPDRPGNDALVGTDLPDEINALGGNDSLSGLGGDDTLIGGPGDDTIFPGLGNDLILPGEGTNQIEGPGNELNGDRIGDGFGPEDAIFVRDHAALWRSRDPLYARRGQLCPWYHHGDAGYHRRRDQGLLAAF